MSDVGSAFRGGAERRRLEAEVGWRRKEDSESKSCLGCGGMTSCPHGGFRMPVVSPTRWILIDESAAWRVRAQIRFQCLLMATKPDVTIALLNVPVEGNSRHRSFAT